MNTFPGSIFPLEIKLLIFNFIITLGTYSESVVNHAQTLHFILFFLIIEISVKDSLIQGLLVNEKQQF